MVGFGLDVFNPTWTFRWLSAVAWLESFGQFLQTRFLCYRLNLAGYMVSLIGWARAKIHGVSVICLVPVFFVFIGLRAVSDQFVSPHVAGNSARDIGLGNDGGNAVLLIDGPVSDLGDLYKLDNCCREFLFGWMTTVHPYSLYARVDLGVTCHYKLNLCVHKLLSMSIRRQGCNLRHRVLYVLFHDG